MKEWLLWLATDLEVRVSKKNPDGPNRRGTRWLPAMDRMEMDEAIQVLRRLTYDHPHYPGIHVYKPQVLPNDEEVQAQATAHNDAEGLNLARFSVDVRRTVADVRAKLGKFLGAQPYGEGFAGDPE